MASTKEGAIQEALFTRLAAMVLTPVHPVAWPNNNFTPPTGNRYIEPKFVPNTTNRILIGSDDPHQRLGFLQVNVRDGLNQGPRIVDIAGVVAAHFPTDLVLRGALGVAVRITSAADVNGMIVETAGVLVPVLIPYECLA